jgi:hypothetical protein
MHFALSLPLFLAMASAACVASPITHLVSVEVIEGLVSAGRSWTNIAVMWIEAVINVALEVVGAVEPRAGSHENAAAEPLGPVVPVWRAVVRGHIVVTIGTNGFCSDVDGDLSGCRAGNAQQSGNQDRKGKEFPIAHVFLLTAKKSNRAAKVVTTERDSHLRQAKAERRTH